jgi:Rne/Rng family ribonuclease
VVDGTAQGTRIGLLENGRLIEVDVADRKDRHGIYGGRVRAIAHAIDGAFVDCGLGADAFLSARDARALSGARRGAPISEQVSEGQAVLVQVKRLAQRGKGPRVGTDVALHGLCLVHRPRIGRVELAPELARSEHGKRQYARAAALFPAGGFSLRPSAMQVSDDELLAEADQLRQRWTALEGRAAALTPPALLDPPGDPLLDLLLRCFSPDLERIVFAERTALIKARSWLEQALPRWLEQGVLEHLPDAFDAMGVSEQLEEAQGREVALANGGYLIIEPTAALTAIDVNGTGRPLDLNLAAVPEVARQLRLRRIGGIVVIDFVDLDTKSDRARLGAALRAAFAPDPAEVQIYPMSPLGLVELSRQRTGPSLAERLGHVRPEPEESADG